MSEHWKNAGHSIDKRISKVLESSEGYVTTVGDIARKINAPCGMVAWHLRQCITGCLLEKPRNGRIEDTKVTKAREIFALALEKMNTETGGFKK